MQEVQLDKNVRLLDSPGIVMATGDETSAHTILRNAVKVEQIEDPVAPVDIILSRCRKDQMMMQYKVSAKKLVCVQMIFNRMKSYWSYLFHDHI